MDFRTLDTFAECLARLNDEEQKAVNTTDLYSNSAHPRLSLPSLDQEVYDTERHLLYVACTRARDHLLITSGPQPSEFLDDLEG